MCTAFANKICPLVQEHLLTHFLDFTTLSPYKHVITILTSAFGKQRYDWVYVQFSLRQGDERT